jgi:hypothetical protein
VHGLQVLKTVYIRNGHRTGLGPARNDEEDGPQGGRQLSKEASRPSGSLTLCRAGMAMGKPSGMSKPRKGDCVEARGRGPKGETLGGAKARRGSARGYRVTPARGERTFRMHESLEPRRALSGASRSNGKRGRARREAWRLPGGGNLRRRKPRGATGMKQGRKGRGGARRQEAEKAWRRSRAG